MFSNRARKTILVLAALIVTACNLPAPAATPVSDPMATMVAATMQALTPLATPTAPVLAATPPPVTPTPTTGSVTGKTCFVNASVPDMNIYLQDTQSGAVFETFVPSGRQTYEIELPPGSYIAYAWLPDFSLGGLYSACPNGSGCSSHAPLPFAVAAGQTVTGVDLCDWYHGPFDVPYPPNYTSDATVGAISGTIYGYPGGADASLTIVAFNQGTHYWYYYQPAAGVRVYTLDNLPPGTYQVVAYDAGAHRGGTPANVNVVAGQTAVADISNWSGSFPANPAP